MLTLPWAGNSGILSVFYQRQINQGDRPTSWSNRVFLETGLNYPQLMTASKERDSKRPPGPNPGKFPDGMKAVAGLRATVKVLTVRIPVPGILLRRLPRSHEHDHRCGNLCRLGRRFPEIRLLLPQPDHRRKIPLSQDGAGA